MRETHKCRTHTPKNVVACTTRQGQRGHDGKEELGEEAPIRGEGALGKGGNRGEQAGEERK